MGATACDVAESTQSQSDWRNKKSELAAGESASRAQLRRPHLEKARLCSCRKEGVMTEVKLVEIGLRRRQGLGAVLSALHQMFAFAEERN